MDKESVKVLARNREAYHEYFVEEEMEAGIELKGTEVKSVRAGTLNLKDAWCGIKDGEMILNQMHISPYDHGNRFNPDPRRPRRLLMHRREIMRLFGKVKQDGYGRLTASSRSPIFLIRSSFFFIPNLIRGSSREPKMVNAGFREE